MPEPAKSDTMKKTQCEEEDTRMQLHEIDFTDSIARILEGDTEGFTFIYRHTYVYFRGIVKKYFSNTEEIEDLLQEIYIKIFTDLKQLREPDRFLAWSKMVVLNTVKNELRKKAAKITASTDSFPLYTEDGSEQTSLEELASAHAEKDFNRRTYMRDYQPEMHLEEAERKQILEEMLSQLPFMQKTCILLWQEGYSTKEIAEQLDIPSGTVLSNIHYSKKKIERKAEELKKRGLIVRSVAPFPFFLWLLDQYDISLKFLSVGFGDLALWKQIQKKLSPSPAAVRKRPRSRVINTATVIKGTAVLCALGVTAFGIYSYGAGKRAEDHTNPSVRQIKTAETGTKQEDPKQKPVKSGEESVPEASKEVSEKAEQEKTVPTEDKASKEEKVSKEEKKAKKTQQGHTHNYNIPIKETVKHEAKGHYEKIWVEDNAAWDEDIYETYAVCSKCGHKSSDTDSAIDHSAKCGGGYSIKEVKVGTKHHEATGHYEKKWVVDEKARTETKTVGWKCSCGAKK